MLNKCPKIEFKIHDQKLNFDLLTHPNVRSAIEKDKDKAGLPRLANRCGTMSPSKPKI